MANSQSEQPDQKGTETISSNPMLYCTLNPYTSTLRNGHMGRPGGDTRHSVHAVQ